MTTLLQHSPISTLLNHFDAHQRHNDITGAFKQDSNNGELDQRLHLLLKATASITDKNQLASDVIYILDAILCNTDADKEAIHKLLNLVGTYSNSPIFDNHSKTVILEHIIQRSRVANEVIRARSVQCLGAYCQRTATMTENNSKSSPDREEMAAKALIDRLEDVKAPVRLAATIAAGHYFASQTNDDDENSSNGSSKEVVLEHLIARATSDSNSNIRCTAIQTLSSSCLDHNNNTAANECNTLILNILTERTRDCKMNVRVAACNALQNPAIGPILRQNGNILRKIVQFTGVLGDRCKETKDAAISLILTHWLRRIYNHDIVDFLQDMLSNSTDENVETAYKLALLLLTTLHDNNSTATAALSVAELISMQQHALHIPLPTFQETSNSNHDSNDAHNNHYKQLSEAILLRARTATLPNNTSILPDVPTWLHIIQHMAIQQPLLLQLLHLTPAYYNTVLQDDVASMRLFVTGLEGLLIQVVDNTSDNANACNDYDSYEDVDVEVLEACVGYLCALVCGNDGVLGVVERVNAVLDHYCASKKELEDHEKEEDMLHNTLIIRNSTLHYLITHYKNKSMPAVVVSTFVQDTYQSSLPLITNTNEDIREAALFGIGCCALFTHKNDKNTTLVEVQHIYSRTISNIQEETHLRSVALLNYLDLCILGCCSSQNLYTILLELLQQQEEENDMLEMVAAECAIRLMMHANGSAENENPVRRQLLAQLLLIYFTYEDTEEEKGIEVGSCVRVHQLLTVFFNASKLRDEEGFTISAIPHMLHALTGIPISSSSTKSVFKAYPTTVACKLLPMILDFIVLNHDNRTATNIASTIQACTYLLQFLNSHLEQIRVTFVKEVVKQLYNHLIHLDIHNDACNHVRDGKDILVLKDNLCMCQCVLEGSSKYAVQASKVQELINRFDIDITSGNKKDKNIDSSIVVNKDDNGLHSVVSNDDISDDNDNDSSSSSTEEDENEWVE